MTWLKIHIIHYFFAWSISIKLNYSVDVHENGTLCFRDVILNLFVYFVWLFELRFIFLIPYLTGQTWVLLPWKIGLKLVWFMLENCATPTQFNSTLSIKKHHKKSSKIWTKFKFYQIRVGKVLLFFKAVVKAKVFKKLENFPKHFSISLRLHTHK